MKSKSNGLGARARPSDDESIEATAAAWLAQRDDALTSEDERKFAAWRAADPRHEAAAARLERAWAALQPLRDFRPEALRHPDRDLLAQPARGPATSFPGGWVAVAAAAALAFAAGWWGLRPVLAPTPVAHYATTIGGYERVMLADGSVLELNGDTEAEVRFTAAERRVRLARGEAHFTVAKNSARPFWVEANDVGVRAVGTAFNVRLGAGEIEVLVTEGKVSVSALAAPTLAPAPALPARDNRDGPSKRSSPTLLLANDRALIATVRTAAAPAHLETSVERVAPGVVRELLSWQDPRLVFVDTPLGEIVAQFNRRNAVQLVLADPVLATLPVGGSFRAENVEAFVRLLESGGEVRVDRTQPAQLVLHAAK